MNITKGLLDKSNLLKSKSLFLLRTIESFIFEEKL